MLFKRLGEEIVPIEIEGKAAWMLAEQVKELANTTPPGVTRLLAAFDQYVIAAPRDESAVLTSEYKNLVYRPQGWLSPVLLIDGQVAGTWSHARNGGRLTVEIAPFARPAAATRRQAKDEAARLADFLGGTLTLIWQP